MAALPIALALLFADPTCRPPGLGPHDLRPLTLESVALPESGFSPIALRVNGIADASQPHPDTAAEAAAVATAWIGRGYSVDVGLMQINSRNFGWLGLTVEKALDACSSIRAAATVLAAFSRYNTGSPTHGFQNGYVAKVEAARRELSAPAPPFATHAPPPARIKLSARDPMVRFDQLPSNPFQQ